MNRVSTARLLAAAGAIAGESVGAQPPVSASPVLDPRPGPVRPRGQAGRIPGVPGRFKVRRRHSR